MATFLYKQDPGGGIVKEKFDGIAVTNAIENGGWLPSMEDCLDLQKKGQTAKKAKERRTQKRPKTKKNISR